MLRHALVLTGLIACTLQEAPTLAQEQVIGWIDDAMQESLAYAEQEDIDKSVGAWRSAYGYFEEQVEPALRYHQGDPNQIAELEYLIGRIGKAARVGDSEKLSTDLQLFNQKLSAILPILPEQPEAPLTH
jgi:hypothetical protein